MTPNQAQQQTAAAILAGPEHTHLVRRAVVELGMTVLPSQIDTTALQVREVE